MRKIYAMTILILIISIYSSGLALSVEKNVPIIPAQPNDGVFHSQPVALNAGSPIASNLINNIINPQTQSEDPVKEQITATKYFTNIGAFRGKTWYLDNNGNGKSDSGDKTYTFGNAGEKPVTGAWNGGFSCIGSFSSATRTWYIDYNNNGILDNADKKYTFGYIGDLPVTGDWNGNGKTEIGVLHGNTWYLDYNGNGKTDSADKKYTFGLAGDKPIAGDWNADGKTEIGVFRNKVWYLDYNGNGKMDSADKKYSFSSTGDIPVTGDWNADGKTEIGVFFGKTWYLDYNGNGKWDGNSIDKQHTFGLAGDSPVSGVWILNENIPNGTLAKGHLNEISKNIGTRTPGSTEEENTAEYISSVFEKSGYSPKIQPFTFQTDDEEEAEVEAEKSSSNIIVDKPGKNSKVIVIGAHYDSPEEGAEGADDNGASVAVLLEVAQRMKNVQTQNTIRFIAFGAEEADLDGSSYYVSKMSSTDIKNTVGMINLDCLIAGDIFYLYGNKGVSIRDKLLEVAINQDYEPDTRTASELNNPDGTPCDCADYSPFEKAGIPFAYFEATNWNLGEKDGLTQVDPSYGEEGKIRHTKYDTIQYLNSSFPGRIDERLSATTRILCDTLIQFYQG